VFVSDDGDYAVEAFEIGAQGYLLYPFDRLKIDRCVDWIERTRLCRREINMLIR
jgi:two-component SAPR family response regulator